ncbi:hypothetical protein AYO47_00285 [Planctomyces sp. SCGC AG-212-M04]|nr:hypothetical protein AYO47_00285 [Planctomyces sp. SCGC AG-212-M04]
MYGQASSSLEDAAPYYDIAASQRTQFGSVIHAGAYNLTEDAVGLSLSHFPWHTAPLETPQALGIATTGSRHRILVVHDNRGGASSVTTAK